MSRDAYNYKRKAITTAKDLDYGEDVIEQLNKAKTENEILRIMKSARERL